MKKNKFAERLNELRQEKGLSQAGLAKELGVRQQCISAWEKGVREANIDMLIQIARYFNCTVGYLCGSTNSRERITIAK